MAQRLATYITLLRVVARASPISTLLKHETPPIGSTEFFWRIGIATCLVLAGGVFAGLTLGLMGLDEVRLGPCL